MAFHENIPLHRPLRVRPHLASEYRDLVGRKGHDDAASTASQLVKGLKPHLKERLVPGSSRIQRSWKSKKPQAERVSIRNTGVGS